MLSRPPCALAQATIRSATSTRLAGGGAAARESISTVRTAVASEA